LNKQFDYIAVDFDGTLFEDAFPEIGGARPAIINWCIKQQSLGTKIILHTCREADRLEQAIAKSEEHGLYFDAVNENPFTPWELTPQSKKPFADLYVDDKAIHPDIIESLWR